VDTQQNADMYCALYGEYYPDNQYFIQGAPPEMCPAHVCAMQSEFGEAHSFHCSRGVL
jgi:hypothetical protein